MGFIDVSRAARTAGRAALDLILPPLCLKCRVPVGQPQSLCGTCWSDIRFLSAPQCAQCGIPFPHALGQGVKCAACIASPPAFSIARAAVAYDDASRDLILGFKHADKLETVPLFARWLTTAGAEALAGADVMMPVPLHWWRLAQRRYNQAAVLAQAIGRLTRLPVDTGTLTRPRATRSQGEMPSARSRLKNVAKAFAVAKGRLDGQKVVLVDDVLTTGATVTACAKALRRAGAAAVSVVTVARVVRPLSLSL
ncbi:MAG: ComF family protein [Alphaproteobacteria bacterium]|nr:ComF family protein [Alphaproteobacteria bacterium]